LTVLAAGSGQLLRARFANDLRSAPTIEREAVPPGATDAVFLDHGRVVYGSPLLDAWVVVDSEKISVHGVDPDSRPALQVRLGEALFFTDLMAPNNVSTGARSRFSCETCHFEGGVDGRTHYTGRGDVSVVTKPLFGLANNRPHFSRAMDRDLSSVSHNEFRVAGAGNASDPWSTISTSRFPWLWELGMTRGEVSALEAREALLAFLYAFSHAPNPRAQGRSRFTPLEAKGAHAFERHCESCHSARLLSDDAASRAQPADWEKLVLSRSGPIVWARGELAKTGVLPYVHERGTRIPSLRRLQLKPRYFTNGSAKDLAAVLAAFRSSPEGAALPGSHASSAPHSGLNEDTRLALAAFLTLL
jgi:hypothetical protein